MKKYVEKPFYVYATQWTGKNIDQIQEITGGNYSLYNKCLMITNPLGTFTVDIGDYVLLYEPGHDIDVLSAEMFKARYLEANED